MFTHLNIHAPRRSGGRNGRCPRSAAMALLFACSMIAGGFASAQAAEPATPFAFEIRHDVSAPYWSPLIVPMTKTGGSEAMHGFDLLVSYDASALNLRDVIPGEVFSDTGSYQWEYFQWRVDSSAFPVRTIRLVAVADVNNGAHHPLTTAIPDGTTLFDFSFAARPQASVSELVTPLRFHWRDCGDNAIAGGQSGESLAVSLAVFEWDGSQFIDVTDPEGTFPTDFGTPDLCFDSVFTPGVTRSVDYFDGAVTIYQPESIDNRGDINVNGIAYEIADWVMFTDYFFQGEAVFPNPFAGVPASDVNNDDIPLRLEDLVFLERIVCGDTLPVADKRDGRVIVDSAIVTQDAASRTVSIDYADTLAGLFLVFQGEITPAFVFDTTGIMAWSEYDGAVTRVMIIPNLGADGCRHGFAPGTLFTYTGNGLLVEQEDSLYTGTYDYPQVADFNDTHFYHNPTRILGTDGRVVAVPDPLSTTLARVSDAETVTLYLGDFDGHTAGDIAAAALRINDSLVPLSTAVLSSYPGFTGEVLTATVAARGFILSLDASMSSGLKSYTVTGQYADEQTFAVVGGIALVSEPAVIAVPSGWPTIQAGIDAAIDDDAVHVAGGTYTGDGNRDLDFNGKRILLTSVTGAGGTVIDCQGTSEANHRFIVFHGDEDTLTVVDGFTIRGGFAPAGGAIYIDAPAAPTIRRCVFTENVSSGDGGAIGIYLSSPIIEDCQFYGNQAATPGRGGAIHAEMAAPVIRNCEFRGNSSDIGGAVDLTNKTGPAAPRPILQDCHFKGNLAITGGGLCSSSSDPILERCVFDSNTVSMAGGGVWGYDASPSLFSCLISRNVGGAEGGGLWLSGGGATLTNCTIVKNEADTGTGMFVGVSSAPAIDKSIISVNASGGAFIIDGTSSVQFTCTDIADNDGGDWVGAIAGQLGVGGNISVDPSFCSVTGNDFTLQGISPCLPNNNDCEAQIGAYGWGCGFACGDINNDSTCTIGDAVFLVAYIFRGGQAPVNMIAADVNEDGEVTIGDAIAIVNYLFRGQDLLNCVIDK